MSFVLETTPSTFTSGVAIFRPFLDTDVNMPPDGDGCVWGHALGLLLPPGVPVLLRFEGTYRNGYVVEARGDGFHRVRPSGDWFAP